MLLKVWIVVVAYVNIVSSAIPEHYAPAVKKPGMPYSFSYGVKDGYSGTDFAQSEHFDGNLVTGSYSVQLPDGRKQMVKYEADHLKGFVADVSYVGEAQYPPPSKLPPFVVKHNVGLHKTSKPLATPAHIDKVHETARELISDKQFSLDLQPHIVPQLPHSVPQLPHIVPQLPHGVSHVSHSVEQIPQLFHENKEISIPKPVSIPQIHVGSLPKHPSIHLQLAPHRGFSQSKLIPKPQLIINDFDTRKEVKHMKNLAFSHEQNHREKGSSGEKYLSEMDYESEREENAFHEKHSQMHDDEEHEEEDNDSLFSGHRSSFLSSKSSDKYEDANLNSDEEENEENEDNVLRRGKSFTSEKKLDFGKIRNPFPLPYRLRGNLNNFFHPRYIQRPILGATPPIYRLLGSPYRNVPLLPLHLLQQRKLFKTYDSAEHLGKQLLFPAYHQPRQHIGVPFIQPQLIKAHRQDITDKFEPSETYHQEVEFDIAKQGPHKPIVTSTNVLPNLPVYIPNEKIRNDLTYHIKPDYDSHDNYEDYDGYGRSLDIQGYGRSLDTQGTGRSLNNQGYGKSLDTIKNPHSDSNNKSPMKDIHIKV